MCNCNRRHAQVTSASLAAAREMAQGNSEQQAMQSAANAISNASTDYPADTSAREVVVVSAS